MSRDFDGSTGFLTRADRSIGYGGYNDNHFSFSCWTYLDAAGSGQRQAAVMSHTYPNDMCVVFEMGDSTVGGGFPADGHLFGGWFCGGIGWFYFESGAVATTGGWQGHCMVFDGTNVYHYIDGALAVSAVAGHSPTQPAVDAAFRIGKTHYDAQNTFIDGKIAECAVWDQALSAGEAAAVSKGLNPMTVRLSALQAYWPIHGVDSPERDWRMIGTGGPFPLTLSGTAPLANHAPVGPMTPFVG